MSSSEEPDEQPQPDDQQDDRRDDRQDDRQDDRGPGISDADLPEDLVASEDNPLAEPLSDDVSREELGMGTPGPTQHDGGGEGSGHEDSGGDEDLED